MSKTSKNVLGDQRGKIGKVVGKVVDGVQIYSALAGAVSNPRTEKQVSHRARFSAIIAVGRAMKGAVRIGYRDEAAKRRLTSSFNMFVKSNMHNVSYDKESATTTIDYAHVTIAEGEVPPVLFSGVTFAESQKVTVEYTGQGDTPGANGDDSVYAIVYSPAQGCSMMGIGTREAGTLKVTLPSGWAGETVHVWGFVRTSADQLEQVDDYGITIAPGSCSSSAYIGTGTVQ